MAEKKCFIMGYPSAGKTTFIAALWQSLMPNSVSTKLHLKQLTGNQTYLTNLGSEWLSGKVFSRTLITEQSEELLILLSDDHEEEITLTFSDFSGEIFNNLYLDRETDKRLKNIICNSDAFVLFINPKTTYNPVNIASVLVSNSGESTNEETNTTYNKIDHDSTVAKLVEMLQNVDYLCHKEDIKLSVIISAWDTISDHCQLPQDFVKQELPLLFQYLQSNTVTFDTKYFGISAQGAELQDKALTEEQNRENVENILEAYESNPIERIQVVNQQGIVSHDITLPLWEIINSRKGGFHGFN